MIWDCVTCGACVEACPVSIEHIDHIVDLRRSRVMVDSQFPAEAEPMLRDVERAGNPWGKPQTERAAWAESLGVRVLEPGDRTPDYLYWVGCAASFDERAKKSAESTAKLLQKAGVDFAILGPREVVSAVGQPIEMKRSGKQTFCCGAGGAHMWMEEKGKPINVERAREAIDTGAETLAVACPFCTVMLDDGVRETGSELRVADVSTLLAESLSSAPDSPLPESSG